MTSQRLIEDYLARARELEGCVQRLQQAPTSISILARGRDAECLRREAAWWRGYAQQLARAA